MSQSLCRTVVHLVFSTKNRVPYLVPQIKEPLRAYLGGILRNQNSPALAVGTVADHVHILLSQSKNHALADIVEEVKKSSSKWIKTQGAGFGDFHWQSGYGGFSVSASRILAVGRYIRNQESHHHKNTFQGEFRRFLKEYEIDYDERYVWD
jgi:REP element-mobilizing transposase RayT